jgi:hypothetical protein
MLEFKYTIALFTPALKGDSMVLSIVVKSPLGGLGDIKSK